MNQSIMLRYKKFSNPLESKFKTLLSGSEQKGFSLVFHFITIDTQVNKKQILQQFQEELTRL